MLLKKKSQTVNQIRVQINSSPHRINNAKLSNLKPTDPEMKIKPSSIPNPKKTPHVKLSPRTKLQVRNDRRLNNPNHSKRETVIN